ncbi:CGNR zinc finger domain-containing protein [Actinoplanes sp. CA-252034]
MSELSTGPLTTRIRQCSGDDCPPVFIDASRPGARR